MNDTQISIRCTTLISNEFKRLAEEDGRKQGKFLEKLIELYKKSKEEN